MIVRPQNVTKFLLVRLIKFAVTVNPKAVKSFLTTFHHDELLRKCETTTQSFFVYN